MRVNPGTIPASVKVLGAGCARCRILTTHTRAALDALGIDAPVEVVDDPLVIADHQVMRLPALVIDGRVVLSGSVPRLKELCTLIDGAITPQHPTSTIPTAPGSDGRTMPGHDGSPGQHVAYRGSS